MSDKKNTVVRGGPSFISLLTLLFITLKLCGVISWGWGVVLAPLLIPISLVGLVTFGACIVTTFKFGWKTLGDWLFGGVCLLIFGSGSIGCLHYLITLIGKLF